MRSLEASAESGETIDYVLRMPCLLSQVGDKLAGQYKSPYNSTFYSGIFMLADGWC